MVRLTVHGGVPSSYLEGYMLLDAVVLGSLAVATALVVFERGTGRRGGRLQTAEAFLVGLAIGAGAVGAALR